MDVFTQLLVGVAAFVATNIDDLFLLAVLFADRELRPQSIVVGQLAGIGGLVAASALAALAAVAIPARWTAWLGVLPLALGLRQLWARRGGSIPDDHDDADAHGVGSAARARGQILAVAAVTLANGGDNLGVYIPLFARAPAAIPLHATTFALLTCAWCWAGQRIVTNRFLADPIRRHGHALLPLVLVGLGIYILSGMLGAGD